jgi:nucleoside-diphosphate-sugar epimerase
LKVLVTGATGFIGRHVVPQLLNRGHTVIATARNEARARGFPWFDGVRFVACNFHDPSIDPSALFDQPEAVMHLAWEGLPNYNALYHFEQNLPAAYRLLKLLVESGIEQLLVTGTCFEYGMQNGCLSEDMVTQPVNPYALAKDTLHRFLQAFRRQHPFILQWTRLFYIHGSGQNPNSLLAQLDRALDNNELVFNMSGGEQLRDYLPVETVALHLVRLLEQRQHNGVFNICSGVPVSIRSLVEQHLAQRGAYIQPNLGYYSYPEHEPMAFWGDARKISAVLKAE